MMLTIQENTHIEVETQRAFFFFFFFAFCSLFFCFFVSISYFFLFLFLFKLDKYKKELEISNAQYGLLQSAVSLVNTIIPFFGGLFIDAFGTGLGSIICSSLITLGSVIVAISTYPSSFSLMIVGRVVYGIGSGCIVTVQEAILAHWFSGKGLAITIGLQIGTSRLAGFLATGATASIAEKTGFYGNGKIRKKKIKNK